jgi:2-dehydro-3-deoxygluconokinase
MALIDPGRTTTITAGQPVTLRVAGAESNVAIALGRLGVRATWISRVGADPLGDMIVAALAGEGVDVDHVRRDSAPTGVFLKWRAGGRSHVVYHRRGSAASRLTPADVPAAALRAAELVHLTGITMGLSATARELVVELARRAREHGIPVVFDPNWRPPLWSSPSAAAAAQAAVLPHVDWYLCGEEEGALLFGTDTPERTLAAARAAGARDAVVRVGRRGCLVRTGAGLREVAPARVVDVVDEVGAGDAFAAGFIHGHLRGWDWQRSARMGNACGAIVVTRHGCANFMPREQEALDFIAARGGF